MSCVWMVRMLGVSYLTAPWCAPCKTFGPTIEKVAEELNIEVDKIDVDLNPEKAMEFGIMSVPATVWWKDGQYIRSFMGAMTEPQLRSFVANLA